MPIGRAMYRIWDWQFLALLLTLMAGGTALAFIPDPSGLFPALRILPAWMAFAAVLGSVMLLGGLIAAREQSPLSALFALVRGQRWRIAETTLILLLAGANMVAFMWVKPLLNYLVPFWADPLLARIDHALFLGHDPWALFAPLALPFAGLVYHQLWFLVMIAILLLAAWAPPSPRRSAVLLTYFLLWSVVGPLVHCLLPAGGPIFYAELGYGDRFASMARGPETQAVADYLWSIYAKGEFGAGAGISAMPSLHVTLAAWMAVATAALAPRMARATLCFALLIAALSVALGWHYAIDGIVGAIATVAVYRAVLHSLSLRGRTAAVASQGIATQAAG